MFACAGESPGRPGRHGHRDVCCLRRGRATAAAAAAFCHEARAATPSPHTSD